jgi:3-oxoadipate enol-lactonase
MSKRGAAARLAAASISGWVAWRLLGPEVARRYAQPQVRPLRIPGRTVIVGEREFFVRETGPTEAPTLVLVHGWSLDAETTYHRIIPELAMRYRILLPDMRNHGRSDWIRGRYSVVDLADELAGVLDALEVSKATVMGYSLGGMVSQELARRHPRFVGRLILAATAARPVPTRRVVARGAFWAGRALSRISTREGALLTIRALRSLDAIDPAHERWMYESLLRRDAELFYEAGAAAVRFDSRSWVGRLRVPVTVVIPTQDFLVPTAAQEELAELLPSAEVIRLEGSGHESILTRSEDFVGMLLGYLDAPS